MPNTVFIDVRFIHTSAPAKKEVETFFRLAGIKDVRCNEIASLYKLAGPFTQNDIITITREILCDPVAQTFSINSSPKNTTTLFMDVWYKQGVTDSVGDSILKACRDLKIQSVIQAFAGTRYEIQSAEEINLSEPKITAAANKYLLNPLVQECKLTQFREPKKI